MKKKQILFGIVLIISFLILTQLPLSLKKAKAIGEGKFTWTFFINKESRGIKDEETINMLFLTNVTNDNQL